MVNVNWYVPPCAAIGLAVPESNEVPLSLVAVWGALVIFFQTTVVPTGMVSDAGLKAKEPLLSVVMVTVFVAPVGAVVAVGAAGAVVAVGAAGAVVAVGLFALPVVPLEPPQAAKKKRTPTISRESSEN